MKLVESGPHEVFKVPKMDRLDLHLLKATLLKSVILEGHLVD